jgi:hypothetical protein
LNHGLLLEVFGLSQDELKASDTESSGEERLGCAASISPIIRSQELDPSSEQVEIETNRLAIGSRPSGRMTGADLARLRAAISAMAPVRFEVRSTLDEVSRYGEGVIGGAIARSMYRMALGLPDAGSEFRVGGTPAAAGSATSHEQVCRAR